MPRRMTDHQLNPLRGWFEAHALIFKAKLSANVSGDALPVYAGRVAHVNASGEYELGLPATIGSCKMPVFLFQNSDDPDVKNDGGDPETEADVWVGATPTGTIMGLVATGGFEVETTEFQSEEDLGDTYEPGEALTAVNSNTLATGGEIRRTTAYSGGPLCGIVSKAVRRNEHGKNVLSLWTYFLPKQS